MLSYNKNVNLLCKFTFGTLFMMSYQKLSDVELIALLKEGDKGAFAAIFDQYKSLLFSHVYKKIRDREEAKDIVQEVFASLWAKRAQINDQSNLGGYLMLAVRHKVLDLVGHKHVEERYFSSLSDFATAQNNNADHRVRENQLRLLIEKEIEALPSKMREIFLMSRVGQLSHKEIAGQLNISEQTVTTQIKRALRVLRVKLGLMLYLAMLIKW